MAKRVLILYTGGTIGMRPSRRGYVPAEGFAERASALFAARRDRSLPEIRFRLYPDPVDSANVRPADWLRIARDIAAAATFDGFVVVHGTDTMAFTGAALSFLLGGLNKPVIVTGSMIPISEPESDGRENLVNAVRAAGCTGLDEVCILLGRRLLRANRATKRRSTGTDPFDSPNCPPLGRIVADEVALDGPLPAGSGLRDGDGIPSRPLSAKVVVQPVFPGLGADDLAPLLRRRVDGVVVPCYGRGTAPTADCGVVDRLRALASRGAVVVAVSQCLEGGVDLGAYGAGAPLREAGIVDGRDMTLEAAFAKLHWLLALGHPPAVVADLAGRNLCGELTPR